LGWLDAAHGRSNLSFPRFVYVSKAEVKRCRLQEEASSETKRYRTS
jgi:hypothetical protein